MFEDGVAQKIETFEHVVATRGPQTARTEPSTQRDMMQAVANPRNRVFLIFLDGAFVDEITARVDQRAARQVPHERSRRRGPRRPHDAGDERIEVTFGKKTEVLERGLRSSGLDWGRQDRELDPELDQREIQYGLCYPNTRRCRRR